MGMARSVLLLGVAVVGLALEGRGQGSLTPPPGPPAPVMKSLDQVEPRTPITNLPYVITAPGAYYLTSNLIAAPDSDGITIATGNVDLDLGGFALTGAVMT